MFPSPRRLFVSVLPGWMARTRARPIRAEINEVVRKKTIVRRAIMPFILAFRLAAPSKGNINILFIKCMYGGFVIQTDQSICIDAVTSVF